MCIEALTSCSFFQNFDVLLHPFGGGVLKNLNPFLLCQANIVASFTAEVFVDTFV
jgi:hypothetical protein